MSKRAVLCIFVLAGCGLDEHYTGMGDRALPGDPLNPIKTDAVCQGTVTPPKSGCEELGDGKLDVADLASKAWRFDTVVLTAPLPAILADPVNVSLKDEIAADRLNVLLLADKDDRTAGTLDLRVGSGKAVTGGYSLDGPGNKAACALTGARFSTTSPTAMDLPISALEPPSLPLKSLKLCGLFSPDGTAIQKGYLEGALTEADARIVTVAGADIATLLVNSEVPMDLDSDGNGTKDAWAFKGTFTAVAVKLVVQ